MEIKDLLSPLGTVIAVFLAARFALRNEQIKKGLDIRTTQLIQLSEMVYLTSVNVMQYAGTLAAIIDAHMTPVVNNNLKIISMEQLHEWKNTLDKANDWALNIREIGICSQRLSFHGNSTWPDWGYKVRILRREIDVFFMITRPGERNIEIGMTTKSCEEVDSFTRLLRIRVKEIEKIKSELLQSMQDEFDNLTRHEPITIATLTHNIYQSIRRFLCLNK